MQHLSLLRREDGGMFEHFKSFGYFENFWKTNATAMWENCRLFMSHRVQLRCIICLAMMQLLFILRHKY